MIIKNTSGQFYGAQINNLDGTAKTSGSVTIYITGDNGTQAVGTVSSGACTHKGNGYWSYPAAQGETNYAHVAATFVPDGTGVCVTNNYYPWPEALATAAALSAVDGKIDTLDMVADAVKAKTDNLPGDPADQSLVIDATNAIVSLINGLNDIDAAAVWAYTTRILTAGTNIALAKGTGVTGFNDLDSTAVQSATAAAITAYDPPTRAELTADKEEILEAVGEIEAGTAPTAEEVAAAVWDEALAGHTTSGSTGEALAAAGGSGDPWITPLPGSYTAGQAGKIVGDYLNAAVGSRATPSDVATALSTYDGPTRAELTADKEEILAAIDEVEGGTGATPEEIWTYTTRILTAGTNISLAKGTGVTGFNDLSEAQVNAQVDVALADYDPPTATEVANWIAALNDLSTSELRDEIDDALLDYNVATVSDVPTANTNADALLNRNVAGGSSTGRTVKEALYILRNKYTTIGNLKVYAPDDTTVAWEADLQTAAGDPITSVDPN